VLRRVIPVIFCRHSWPGIALTPGWQHSDPGRVVLAYRPGIRGDWGAG